MRPWNCRRSMRFSSGVLPRPKLGEVWLLAENTSVAAPRCIGDDADELVRSGSTKIGSTVWVFILKSTSPGNRFPQALFAGVSIAPLLRVKRNSFAVIPEVLGVAAIFTSGPGLTATRFLLWLTGSNDFGATFRVTAPRMALKQSVVWLNSGWMPVREASGLLILKPDGLLWPLGPPRGSLPGNGEAISVCFDIELRASRGILDAGPPKRSRYFDRDGSRRQPVRPLRSISRQACWRKAVVTWCSRPTASIAFIIISRLEISMGVTPEIGSSLAK